MAGALLRIAGNPKLAGLVQKATSFAAKNPELVGTALNAASQLQGVQTPFMSFPQPTYAPIQTGYMPPPSQAPMDYYQPQTMPVQQPAFYMPDQVQQPAFYMPEQAGPLAGMPVSGELASTGFSFFALFYSFGSAFLPFIWVFLQPTILPFMFGQIILFGGITLGLKYMADWEWRNSAIAGWLVQGIIFFFIYFFINRNLLRLATGF